MRIEGADEFSKWVFCVSDADGFEPAAHVNNERSDYVYVASRPKEEANPTRGAEYASRLRQPDDVHESFSFGI